MDHNNRVYDLADSAGIGSYQQERVLAVFRPPQVAFPADLSAVAREQANSIDNLREKYAERLTNMQQRLKKCAIRIFGIQEEPNEDLQNTILEFFSRVLRVVLRSDDLAVFHRSGVEQPGHPRSIVVRFVRENTYQLIWSQKQRCVDKNVGIVEELCIEREQIWKKACEIFGEESVFISDGYVQVLINGSFVPFPCMEKLEVFLERR